MIEPETLKVEHPGLSLRLLGRVDITAVLTINTGLHIGSGDSVLQIGGVDKVVVKDPADGFPYVPFSSLRGRMRALLEAAEGLPANRKGGDGVYRHECDDANDAVGCPLCRVFGTTSDTGTQVNFPSRLKGVDLFLKAKEGKTPSSFLELKSENALDRLSAHANPRVNERVRRGSTFDVALRLDLKRIEREGAPKVLIGKDCWGSATDDLDRQAADIRNTLEALALVEATALGGNSSRGYGAVSFSQVAVTLFPLTVLRGRGGAPRGRGGAPACVLSDAASARAACEAGKLSLSALQKTLRDTLAEGPSGS